MEALRDGSWDPEVFLQWENTSVAELRVKGRAAPGGAESVLSAEPEGETTGGNRSREGREQSLENPKQPQLHSHQNKRLQGTDGRPSPAPSITPPCPPPTPPASPLCPPRCNYTAAISTALTNALIKEPRDFSHRRLHSSSG